jgi:hypothetical protein
MGVDPIKSEFRPSYEKPTQHTSGWSSWFGDYSYYTNKIKGQIPDSFIGQSGKKTPGFPGKVRSFFTSLMEKTGLSSWISSCNFSPGSIAAGMMGLIAAGLSFCRGKQMLSWFGKLTKCSEHASVKPKVELKPKDPIKQPVSPLVAEKPVKSPEIIITPPPKNPIELTSPKPDNIIPPQPKKNIIPAEQPVSPPLKPTPPNNVISPKPVKRVIIKEKPVKTHVPALTPKEIERQAIAQSRKYNKYHEIDFDEKILPGYRDAGRLVEWHVSGKPVDPDRMNREIICVRDLKHDPHLRNEINRIEEYFDWHPSMSEPEKIRYLNEQIDQKMWNYRELDDLPPQFGTGKEVSLGEFLKEEVGVCRHRALFMKVLADHLGLKAKLVRGWYGSLDGGPHVWNIFKLQNGKKYLVDPMHRKILPMHDPHVTLNYNAGFKGINMRTGEAL